MSHAASARCSNHGDREGEANCQRCGRPFCAGCLVQVLGQRLCAVCKLARMRGLYYSKVIYPERVVFWARVFDWVLAAPALFWGAFALVDSLRPEKERDEHMMLAVIVAIIGLLFPLAPALALGPGRRWAYYYQMLTLTIGSLLGGCSFGPLIVLLWVPAGILLYYLNRPEVRRYCEDGL